LQSWPASSRHPSRAASATSSTRPSPWRSCANEYRSVGGRIVLDLTNLNADERTFRIAASVGVGRLVIILPEQASVEVRTRVGAGDSVVLGSREAGTSLDDRFVRHHLNQTTYILDLEMGIGEIFVTNSEFNW